MDRLWRNDAMAVFKMFWLRGFELCFVDIRAAKRTGDEEHFEANSVS